jgi:hypothetical protein
MGYECVIHESERYVDVCFSGDLTTKVVLSYLQTVWADNSSIAGFSELVDLRNVGSVDMNTGQLADIVKAGRALDDSSQRSKIALVVTDLNNFYKGETYVTLQQFYPADNKEVELFKDEASARQWLLRR